MVNPVHPSRTFTAIASTASRQPHALHNLRYVTHPRFKALPISSHSCADSAPTAASLWRPRCALIGLSQDWTWPATGARTRWHACGGGKGVDSLVFHMR
eukprot:5052160-Pleurochrysis_carterae.AAC.1